MDELGMKKNLRASQKFEMGELTLLSSNDIIIKGWIIEN